MNQPAPQRSVSTLNRNAHAFAVLTTVALGLGSVMPSPANAHGHEQAAAPTTTALEQAAQGLRTDYRQLQWQRLAKKQDRDSLIAAVLIGMAGEDEHAPLDGEADVEQHLAGSFGHDPLALFTLALACQMQRAPCAYPEAHDALVRIAPDNAVHWFLLPNGAAPSAAQLHAAATAKQADTHLRDIFRIVLAALADQPAPALRQGVDPRELALELRRGAIDQVMVPMFAAVVKMCKGVDGPRRDDCIALGRLFENDRSGSILSRMIGSAMLRRLVKGTSEDVAAKQLRREYVWMAEQQDANPRLNRELLENEVVTFGEWEAWKRSVERMGMSPVPPAGWIPKNPQTLLLSEERTPVPAK